jgi:hypothetical protein
MGNNMTSNWLLAIRSKHCTAIDLGHHLISDYNCDTKLISNPLKGSQKFSQVHLPCG